MSYIMIFGSLHLYYEKDYDFDITSFKQLYNNFKSIKKKDYLKLSLIVSLNSFTLGMYIFTTIS